MSQKSKLIANIFKRFSQIFGSSKTNSIVPDPPTQDSENLKTSQILTNKKNKIMPYSGGELQDYNPKEQINFIFPKKKTSLSVKTNFMFQSLKRNNVTCEENYELEYDGVFDYKDQEEKAELFDQLQQILSKDDNEEDYKLVKLMKNEALENEENEIGMYDLYERETEKFEKLALEHSCLFVQKKNPFELLQLYADRWPCLELRKKILFYQILISHFCELIIKFQYFNHFIIFIIIWNSFIMSMQDPEKEDQNIVYVQMEEAFLIVYTVEMFIKICGMGFIYEKTSYLRDPWNVFDFLIIITSYLPLFVPLSVQSFKFSSFRILRILRPLRAISSIKSLKLIVLTFGSSLPLLMDILLILSFFFLIFAIIGTHLFSDLLKNRCFDPFNGLKPSAEILCGHFNCEEGLICGRMIANPYYNVLNFDNLLYSLIMIFQCMTLQAWGIICFSVVRVFNPWSQIYFILIVILGGFFLLNLTLAVIKTKFTDVQRGKMVDDMEKNNKDIKGIDVIDLKRFKKIERTHFKRRKIDVDGIGASKENTLRMFELTWEDLFDLKERIKEENEREEADRKFRTEREDNLRNEEKVVQYMKKIQEHKKKSFKNFLAKLSVKKKSPVLISKKENFGLQLKGFHNDISDFDNEKKQESEDMLKINNFSLDSGRAFIDQEKLKINDLKTLPTKSLKNQKGPSSVLVFQDKNQMRTSLEGILKLPHIKEEASDISNESNILSFDEIIKSPKSSIMNDSDFNNSFTLKKCKLVDLKENAMTPHTQIPENSNIFIQTPNSHSNSNNFSNTNNILSETPFFCPLITNKNFLQTNFLTNHSSDLDTNTMNNGFVRKSILKKSVQGLRKSLLIDVEKNNKLHVSGELRYTEKNTPQIIFDKSVKNPNKKEKKKNIRYYKLMIDSLKEIVSWSKEDVLDYRSFIKKLKK